MVTAGVYLVARLAPVFATATLWRPIVFAVGSVTILAAGLHALRQHDLKLMLAFGTVSQLGFMMVLFGAGTVGRCTRGLAPPRRPRALQGRTVHGRRHPRSRDGNPRCP